MEKSFTQIREGLRVDFNVPIQTDDGLILRANVYRPAEEGKYPVILSYGPYGKDLHVSEIYYTAWNSLLKDCPENGTGSTNIHQSWELMDPEKWCPEGYALVRVDSRGAGCSPGYLDVWSSREAKDIYDCVEWAAAQSWCNGKVGMNGISYYSVNSWQAAELQPPHLAAVIAWEGFSDYYRNFARQGGILCQMADDWNKIQNIPLQYGMGDYGFKSRVTGKNVSGDVTLSSKELFDNRADLLADILAHPLDDGYYHDHKTNDFSKITVPLLSAANWGGQTLHLKGNIDGFVKAGSGEKWLEVHGKEHWTNFYSEYGVALQKQFFARYLKGENNGWDKRQKVQLQIRDVNDAYTTRMENEWPIARTEYKKLYFDAESFVLSEKPGKAGAVTYRGITDEGVTFLSAPLQEEMEITGHSMAKLVVSSDTSDADLFLALQVFKPNLEEVTFAGANDPHTPVALGWLRASHRKLDEKRSTFYQPYHAHDELWPLEPGKPVELSVEIWPTCIVVPKGYRIGLSIRGKDYVCAAASDGHIKASNAGKPLKGVANFTHDDPLDRPAEIFDGNVTLHMGEGCYLQIPVIPKSK